MPLACQGSLSARVPVCQNLAYHARVNPALLIAKKRDGGKHSPAEIESLIDEFMLGRVTDYQMAAWLMATFFRGLDEKEVSALTNAMLHSGKVLKLESVRLPKVDKHSTGGVGDKISLCLAPLVACCGVAVPMISGRGLGHTGGTLDKLESIPGYRVKLDTRRFERIVREVGVSMIGQTEELAPADRRIYALRDVTGTVECIPLIVASILSKKLAEGIDALVLDVKVGRGAFMKDLNAARELARALVRVGRKGKKRVVALLTRMDAPLGRSIGNALELAEALEVLNDRGPEDSRELTLRLGMEMLLAAGVTRRPTEARRKLEHALVSGAALTRFAKMVKAHGGDPRVVFEPDRLPKARQRLVLSAKQSGVISEIDALSLGLAAVEIGAGRARADQAVDPAVGFELSVRVGDRVARGAPLGYAHVQDKQTFKRVQERVLSAFVISKRAPKPQPLILERIV